MATHASILSSKIPWIEEPGGYNWKKFFKKGRKELDMTEQLSTMSHKFSTPLRKV